MRTSGGKRFDPSEARERCVSNGPQGEPRSGESSSITDQIQKPCSTSRVFLHLKPDEDENLRGRRFDSSEARERCVSNGPQGESRSGESSSITDQIQKPCSTSRVFLYLKPDEDENLRGQEVRPERSERTLRQQRPAGRATQWRVILYHRPNSETLLNKQGFFVSEA